MLGSKKVEFDFLYRYAGLVTVHCGNWAFHLLPLRRYWVWGFKVEPVTKLIDFWGAGPLFLVAHVVE